MFIVNRNEYLQRKEEDLKDILDNNTEFRNYINQIFAKKIGAKFKDSYNELYLWRYALYLSSKGALLLEEDSENHVGTESLKTAAEIYENLYHISKFHDNEYSLMLSSICYDLAGYQANAQCLIDKLVDLKAFYSLDKDDSDILLNYENKILKTIQLFLQKKIFLLSEEIRNLDIDNADFYSHYNSFFNNYSYSINSLCNYILKGQQDEFLDEIIISYEDALHSGNVLLSHLIGLFKTRLKLFKSRNIWDVMRNQIDVTNTRWNNYLKLLSMDIYKPSGIKSFDERISILEFWKSQLNAINYGILINNENYIIQMPTNTGKTFIAEILILNSLIENPGTKCIYIAPFRALTSEIEDYLSNKLGKLGFVVSSTSGTYEIDEYQFFWVNNADVLVATPEKIDLLYRLKPEFFENISLIVTDEGHIIGNEDERSSMLEFLIIKLKKNLKNTRFLFISAVMSNEDSEDFSKWFSNQPNNVITSPKIYGKEWEPTRKLIGMFEWYKYLNSGQIIYPYEKIEEGKPLFLPNIIEQTIYNCVNPTSNRPNRRIFPNNKLNRSEAAVELAYKFVDDGNVLIFTSRPDWAISIGNAFLRLLKYSKLAGKDIKNNFEYRKNLESIEMAKKWLGNNDTITKCLKHGIGIHYGPLAESVRKSIEKDFREKNIEILISTNTIGQGLNFPIKTAVIHSLEINPKEEKRISIRDFWNIVGRAGRAGKETEGQIIFLNLDEKDELLFRDYTDKNNIEPIKSQIFRLMENLLVSRIISLEEFNYKLELLIEPSLLNILMEEAVDTIDEEFIENFFGYSLFKIQLDNENIDLDILRDSIMSLGRRFYSNVEDKNLREIYSKTGFHLSSCVKISNFVEHNIDEIKTLIDEDDYKTLLNGMLFVFLEIYEMNNEKLKKSFLYDYRKELNFFVSEWITGTNISELNKVWKEIFVENKNKNKMQIYINQFLEYRYPWGATVFLLILIHHLKLHFDNVPKKFDDLPEKIKNLPAFLKYGLNDPIACMIKSLGINTREACLELAKKYNGKKNLEEFLFWISNIDLIEFKNLTLSEYEIKNIQNVIQNLNLKKWSADSSENLECHVRGIYDQSHVQVAEKVEIGDVLILERDLDNPYDIYSIKLMYENSYIGFVSRDIAKLIAIEMDLNEKQFQAIVIDKKIINNFYDILIEIMNV